jgi:hypothetical protein
MTKPITTAQQLVDWLFTNREGCKATELRLHRDDFYFVSEARLEADVLAKVNELLASQWRPIAEAPRHATPILVGLIEDRKVWRASDAKFYGVGFYTLHGGQSCHWATHFQPLPAPPEES